MTSLSVPAVLTEGLILLAQPVTAGAPSFAKRLPDNPNRALAWTAYRTMRHPSVLLDGYAIQIRGRGSPDDELDVDELMDPLAEWFASIEHVDITVGAITVHINQVLFRVSAPMGTDADNRTERADTFDLDINPPATARRPF